MTTTTTERKVWTREQVLEKLAASDVFVERALLALYDRQTSAEQSAGQTSEDNGVGFNGVDAPILSSFAEWVKRVSRPEGQYAARAEGKRLSDKQRAIARKKLRKYVRQLVDVANSRGGN